jgi:hypothetical protein
MAGRVHGHDRELDAVAAAAARIAAVLRAAVESGWIERWQPEHEFDSERRRPGIAVPGAAVDEWEPGLGRQPVEQLLLQ